MFLVIPFGHSVFASVRQTKATYRNFLRIAGLMLPLLAPAAHAVNIDGRIDPEEWRGAQHITDFRQTQPLTRQPTSLTTEAWMMATPEGLAVAFRNTQPAAVARTRQFLQRDQNAQADRVNVYVDFNGDGRIGYDFRVYLSNSISDLTVTNENQFNADWDGEWQHATSEDATGWSAELLIPWSIAPMRDSGKDTRTLGIQLDRVVGVTGVRASWPAVSFTEQRYLSAFNRIELSSYRQSLLAVTPYFASVQDFVSGKNKISAGADIFWKPSGAFQLSATVNPDFGQVESDALVVNFSATESFFSEKRPFFTENQNFFDVPFGAYDGRSRLIYTRRIGATADDRSEPGDVLAAVKVNASVSGLDFGVFSASERGGAGRDFHALRVTRDGESQGFGITATHVDRPYLDRSASVFALDHRWTPGQAWSIRTALASSSIRQQGRTEHDTGAQTRIDWDLGRGIRQQLYLLHLGRAFSTNDFGYLERNNFNLARYQFARRFTAFPSNSVYGGSDWRVALSTSATDHGQHLSDSLVVHRSGQFRNGATDEAELGIGPPWHDDRVTRNHGIVGMRSSLWATYDYAQPRHGDGPWSFEADAGILSQGIGPFRGFAWHASVVPTFHASDRLRLFAGVELSRDPEWLVWRNPDQRLVEYHKAMASINAGTEWVFSDRQELRIRLEAIGLGAKAQRVWNTMSPGPAESASRSTDFGVRSVGFQVRYRYELAPLSYLYLAYVRGGDMLDGGIVGSDVQREFKKSIELRDSEQFLVKLSYRFQ